MNDNNFLEFFENPGASQRGRKIEFGGYPLRRLAATRRRRDGRAAARRRTQPTQKGSC